MRQVLTEKLPVSASYKLSEIIKQAWDHFPGAKLHKRLKPRFYKVGVPSAAPAAGVTAAVVSDAATAATAATAAVVAGAATAATAAVATVATVATAAPFAAVALLWPFQPPPRSL